MERSLIRDVALLALMGAVVLLFVLVSGSKEPTPNVTVGAAGSIVGTPYFQFGGVTRVAARLDTLQSATTTPCALQAPSATSTLISGGVRLGVGTTTAGRLMIHKAATAFATTTLINETAYSANTQATVNAASSTVTALSETNRTFAPNEWLVFSMNGGTGTFSPSGVCEAVWETF